MNENQKPPVVRLDLFGNDEFCRGASRLSQVLWLIISGLLFSTWLPGSVWRRALLRAFGAKLGKGVVIKPYVSIKFPWRLSVGNYVWIGERVWIDNLAEVQIGSHSCLSQGAYLCTGSHDWSDLRFGLIARGISIGSGCWVGARVSVAPGTVMEDGSIITMQGLARGKLTANRIYSFDGKVKLRLPDVAEQATNIE